MSSRRIESFLLRLVVQGNESTDPDHWRGRIQHVATGTEQQVEQLQDIIAFIVNLLEATDPPSPTLVPSQIDPASDPRNAS